MKIGLSLPQAGQGEAARGNIIHAAKLAEENGFDSVWIFERLLWPINPQSSYPATSDGRLPVEYQDVMDPLTTLSFVAANTTKIKLGTSVIDVLFHNPVVLSKRFATLDILSEGRSIAGLGIGWLKDEYMASNIPYINRGRRADEFVQLLKAIWMDNNVTFKGEFYDIPPSIIGPKPVQKPHIPIYLGGSSPNTIDRIVKYDLNGWLGVLTASFEQLDNMLRTIRDRAIQHKKDPNSFDIILLTHPKVIEGSNTSKTSSLRFPMTGTIDEIGADIVRVKKLGVNHIIFGYSLSHVFNDDYMMIDQAKEFSKFAR